MTTPNYSNETLDRIKKLEKIKDFGVNPFATKFDANHQIAQILEKLIVSWGENPDQKWIQAKVESALQRSDKREINFAQEVRDFVLTSNGFFLTSDVFNRLQVTSRQEKKNIVVNLLRLKKEGIIEKHGQKDGCYRRI